MHSALTFSTRGLQWSAGFGLVEWNFTHFVEGLTLTQWWLRDTFGVYLRMTQAKLKEILRNIRLDSTKIFSLHLVVHLYTNDYNVKISYIRRSTENNHDHWIHNVHCYQGSSGRSRDGYVLYSCIYAYLYDPLSFLERMIAKPFPVRLSKKESSTCELITQSIDLHFRWMTEAEKPGIRRKSQDVVSLCCLISISIDSRNIEQLPSNILRQPTKGVRCPSVPHGTPLHDSESKGMSLQPTISGKG